jgi:hypothetical protein
MLWSCFAQSHASGLFAAARAASVSASRREGYSIRIVVIASRRYRAERVWRRCSIYQITGMPQSEQNREFVLVKAVSRLYRLIIIDIIFLVLSE